MSKESTSSIRAYLVFGSTDGANWALISTVLVTSAQQALNKARSLEEWVHYAAVPERNWASATPEVKEREPVITWKPLNEKQLAIDDEPKEPEAAKDEVIAEAKALLGADVGQLVEMPNIVKGKHGAYDEENGA